MSKTLIVGGARPGIGQAVLQKVAGQGDVVATYERDSDPEVQEFVNARPDVEWVAIDSTKPRETLQTLESVSGEFSRIVHSDFYFYMENRDAFDMDRWDRSLFANLTVPKILGHLSLTRWAAEGRAVFITSSEANTGSFGAHAYAATKAATHNLARSLANVSNGAWRYNCVAAGWIGGVMDTDEVFERSRAVTPLGRLGTPQEIAQAVVWLLSDDASFINGATLFADGGYTGVDTISRFEFESEYGELKRG